MQVISTSRDDETPIFAAIMKTAQSLYNAPMAGLISAMVEDEVQTLATFAGMQCMAVYMFASGRMKVDPALSDAAKSIVEGTLFAAVSAIVGSARQSDLWVLYTSMRLQALETPK
jgi:hypothetical protein